MVEGNMLSLQSLCLQSIVTNFQHIHLPCIASNDPKLQRNLHFLQRRFSDHVACKLLRRKKRIDPYFDFLITEHLTEVDFKWFKKSRYLKPIDDIFRRLPNLRKIRFQFYGNKILECIARFCPRIVEIDAAFCTKITSKGLSYLCETKDGQFPCPELKTIDIMGSSLTDKDVIYLIQSLPSIEKLNYPPLPLVLHSIHSKNSFKSQEVHFNLKELDLTTYKHIPYPTNVVKSCITVCPKLESIECNLSGKEQLNVLTKIHPKSLTLYMVAKEYTNIDDFIITNGNNLAYLCISSCSVSASALSMHCPALKNLDIIDVDFTDDGDLESTFPSLTSCSLSYGFCKANKAIRFLSSFSPKLESVSFTTSAVLSFQMPPELERQILIWCANHPSIDVEFKNMSVKISFLQDLILKADLKRIRLLNCNHDVPENDADFFFKVLIGTHQNPPMIEIL